MTAVTPDQALVSAFRAGDQDAAASLFERYYARLLGLIRNKQGWRLREVEGSADVAQSVLQSFFALLRQNTVQVGPDDSLWPLLVTITLNKMRNRAKFWQRERRDPSREVPLDAQSDPLERGPSPDDAAALGELVQQLMTPFSERRRKIIQLILEGQPVHEIAAQVGTTERTIYNTRRAAAKILERVLTAG